METEVVGGSFLTEKNNYLLDDEELELKSIKQELNDILEEFKTLLTQTKDVNPQLYFNLCTNGGDLIKSYGLYLRDAYLELIYAQIKFKSELVSEEKLISFKTAQLKDYKSNRKKFFTEINGLLANNSINESTKIPAHQIVENPIEIYLDQFVTLNKQLNLIQRFENQTRQLNLKLNYVRNSLINGLEGVSGNLSHFEDVDKYLSITSHDELPKFLLEIEKDLKKTKTKFSKQTELNAFVSKLEPIEVYPSYISGHLEAKNINTPLVLQNWLDLSAYISIDKLQNKIIDSIEIQLLKYKFIFESTEEINEDTQKELLNWKNEFQTTLTDLQNQIDQEQEKFHKKLSLQSIVFSTEDKSIDLSQTYDFIKEPGLSWYKLKEKFYQLLGTVNKTLFPVEDDLTLNEKIINSIKHSKSLETNLLFKKIFLNQTGLQGQLIVNRQSYSSKMDESISNWSKNIGNSVLVTGNKFCGKTTFLSSIEYEKNFQIKLNLVPEKELSIEGRKFIIQKDFKLLFEEILKSITPSNNYFVVIDDLHLWRSDELSIAKNISNLFETINTAPSNIFFAISCNRMFYKKMKIVLNCDKFFSRILNLSTIEEEEFLITVFKRLEILQANTKGENTFEQNKVQNISKKILKNNYRNVGLSLLNWVEHIDAEGAILSKKTTSDSLPWVVDENNLQLLDNLILFERCTYLEIIQNFPPTHHPEIKSIISNYRRLTMIENTENQIYLSPNLVDPIELQLNLIENKNLDLNKFLLVLTENENIDLLTVRNKILEHLFFFPFKSSESLVDIKISNSKLELKVMSVEVPRKIIQYLNEMTLDYQVTFKQKIN